ncbi:Mariner Mos1 transposase, partial [Blattella germanica]
ELLQHYQTEGEQFLRRILTIDETWIRDFEPELKSQISQWKSPRTKKFRCQQSKVKLMMTFAYDMNGVIATNIVSQRMSVTGAYYRLFIQNLLRPKIPLRRHEGMFASGVIILHDNARPHTAITVRGFREIWMGSTSPSTIHQS